MCYDIKEGTKSFIKYAKLRGDDSDYIQALEKQLSEYSISFQKHYHISGFAHPHVMVFTNEKPMIPQSYQWGLIPFWVKDKATAHTLWNKTLNAMGETIFEKPSFRNSAKHKRCLIYIDAFYEYHHAKGKTFPYHISMKDDTPIALAGLWDEWVDIQTGEIYHTATIVTTKANNTLNKIHNNPKLTEPRMPVILPKNKQEEWLSDYKTDADQQRLIKLLLPFDDNLLRAYTVRKLKGKDAVGDNQKAEKEYVYEELK